jgi:hypothetical protein
MFEFGFLSRSGLFSCSGFLEKRSPSALRVSWRCYDESHSQRMRRTPLQMSVNS